MALTLTDESEIEIQVYGRFDIVAKTWAVVKTEWLFNDAMEINRAKNLLQKKYRYHNKDSGLTLRVVR